MTLPIPAQYTGEGFRVLPRFQTQADQHYVVGQVYRVVEEKQRSRVSHDHYFACVAEAWSQLPEHLVERFPTAEHLRKFALIKCGYRDERSIACSSKAEALRLAAFIKPMDEYALVIVSGSLVSVYTAKSQSKKAMGGADFQESKTAVIDYVAGLIGVETDALTKNARQAA